MMFRQFYKTLVNGWYVSYGPDDLVNYLAFLFSRNAHDKYSPVDVKSLSVECVVISLAFRLDRRNYIMEHFRLLNLSFRFIDAVHGRTEKSVISSSGDIQVKTIRHLSNGSLGCIASHMKVWRELINSSRDAYLVFEDDVVLYKNAGEIEKLMLDLPADFDIVYMGYGSTNSGWNVKMIADRLAKVFSVRKGAYAYVISKKGAAKILSEMDKVVIARGGIDTILGLLMMRRKLQAYVFIPVICDVNKAFSSNIRNLSFPVKPIHNSESNEWNSYH